MVDLQAAINCYLKERNGDPKPFVWTKPLTPSSAGSTDCLHLPFESVHQHGPDLLRLSGHLRHKLAMFLGWTFGEEMA